jgi:hypothetical protein
VQRGLVRTDKPVILEEGGGGLPKFWKIPIGGPLSSHLKNTPIPSLIPWVEGLRKECIAASGELFLLTFHPQILTWIYIRVVMRRTTCR